MTAAPAQPRTARLFLFGGADNADGLARLLDRQGVTDVLGEALRALSGAGRRAAGDQVAGGVGVSGGHYAQDMQVAEAGVAAFDGSG